MPFSFVVIGEESLTVRCAELLVERGHEARAVVAESPAVRAWAEKQDVRALRPSELHALQGLAPFDYLLSIVNLRMLPKTVLDLPAVAAINFHDGPLPRHAGVNAPFWALIEGDTSFGISWHLMETDADTGPVLESRSFAIDPEETGLSINLKCFEAAYDSFEGLLPRLEARNLVGTDQDLSARSYHGATDRPVGAGVIDFAAPAREITTLVRALDFGSYKNPIGFAKLWTPAGVVLVTRARSFAQANAVPGRILAIDADGLTIGTASEAVRLDGFRDLDGRTLSPFVAAGALDVAVGDELPSLAAALRDTLSEASRSSARYEGRAANILGSSAVLPLVRPAAQESGRSTRAALLDLSGAALASAFGNLAARLADADVSLWIFGNNGQLHPVVHQLHFTGRPVVFRATQPRPESDAAIRSAIGGSVLARDVHARVGTQHDGDRIALFLGEPPADDLERFDLSLVVDGSGARWDYDASRFRPEDLDTLAETIQAVAATGDLYAIPAAQQRLLSAVNETETSYDTRLTISESFEAVAAAHPERAAVTGAGVTLTYAELNSRANRLAWRLIELGAGPDTLVAVHVERSVDTVTTLLGVLKAGAAYVPVDPTYPESRKRLMIEDSAAPIVVTSRRLTGAVEIPGVALVTLEDAVAGHGSAPNLQQPASSENLAYVIYTSGSTGRPKGVMLTHRNAQNFFAGMDARIGKDPSTWLAVTSISFDISILELLWTVTRGCTVVVNGAVAEQKAASPAFSLFFFASEGGEGRAAYDLVLKASKFADENGFEAVWTPERHFHAFGGAFPNPSVMSAAIAATTSRVKIRSGSCVLPLHSPIRVAEEWSVVDNLSGGRVGVSFAAGWQPDDFVFNPAYFGFAKQAMLRDIPVVQALWRGEARTFPGPGRDISVRVLPRPVQAELPTWITSAGDPETFRIAGEMGANILTHLLGQSVESVAERVRTYREAWAAAGHQGSGIVTLMLHTHIGDDEDEVRDAVREPMIRYLGSSVGLIKQFASSFPTFKSLPQGDDPNELLNALPPEELRELLEIAFERYYETSGLFGTPERAKETAQRIHEAGVDEIACLVDFGLPDEAVFAGLEKLGAVMREVQGTFAAPDDSVAALIRDHRVTHLQCTPSMAALLLADPANRAAFKDLQLLMVGGEALPGDLAAELVAAAGGRVMNMYGPTETTIWSTTSPVGGQEANCPIGAPIANTSVYILDRAQRQLPLGMAGELWIGGEGVARGYLQRPELTEERFRPDPYSVTPGARMYRTGDLVRIRPDGILEFLGRLDQQVKVRGYRIEPGEIEAALRALPGVVEAAVIAREDSPGDQRLVAYLVAGTAEKPADTTLRQALGASLPEYMVPTNFVWMESLPLTPNAKLDRKALPAPSAISSAPIPAPSPTAAVHAADSGPRDFVAATWRTVLQTPDVPLDRSFFDLGGNSLLLLQVHKRLKEHHPALRLTDLFKYPTVGDLAAHLADNVASTTTGQDAMNRANARRAALARRPVTV